jgi:hypothetical protein
MMAAGQEVQPRITLLVTLSDGTPSSWAFVEARNERGEVDFESKVIDGKVEILDLGIGPHSIRVDCNACATVELKDIFFYAGNPQKTYRIILNSSQGSVGQMGRGCDVLLRLRDEDDRPLHPATIARTGTDTTYETDEYGRARLILGAFSAKQFLLSTPGRASCDMEIKCGLWGRIERTVTMTADGCSIEEYDNMVWGRGRDPSQMKR